MAFVNSDTQSIHAKVFVTGPDFLECQQLSIFDNGFIYLTGSFDQSIDFDPGPEEFILTTIGSQEPFVLKLSPDGDFIWVKKIDVNIDRAASATGLVVDDDGDIYLSGTFIGIIDLDPGTGEEQHDSDGGIHAFLVKLDEAGDFVWGSSFGSGLNTFTINTLVIHDNFIHTSGRFGGSVDMDPSVNELIVTSSDRDFFVQKIGYYNPLLFEPF